MSKVVDYADVRVYGTHETFPFVKDPFYVATDFPWQYGNPNWKDNLSLITDFDLQAIYPAPIVVPHNQTKEGYTLSDCGGGALPSLEWSAEGGTPLDFRCSQPWGFNEIYNSSTQAEADGAVTEAVAQVACQGLLCFWSRYDQNQAFTAEPEQNPYTTWFFYVGAGDNEIIYSVAIVQGRAIVSREDPSGLPVPPKELQIAPVSGDVYAATWGKPDPEEYGSGTGDPYRTPSELKESYNTLEVRLIGGRISFRINGQHPVIVFEEDRLDESSDPLWQIMQVRVRAIKYVRFACSAHPLKWTRTPVFVSQEIQIGFTSTNHTTEDIIPAGHVPDDWDVFIYQPDSSLDGPIIYYCLQFEGPLDGTYRQQEYSDTVAAVRAVNIPYTPVVIGFTGAGRPASPEIVSVSHQFDINTLTVESQMSGHYQNNHPLVLPTGGLGTWAMWSRFTGQTGVTVDLARTNKAGNLGPIMRAFTGFYNTSSDTSGADGDSRTAINGLSRMIQTQNPRFALPWMDGWNVFYAIAYFAQLGGIDLSQMAFSHLVPPTPFEDYGDEDGQPAYFLPVGSGGSYLTRFSGINLDVAMMKIAYSIGYMLFPDVFGFLQFRKFRVPLGVKRDFYESDRASEISGFSGYGGLAGLEGAQWARVSKDMSQVRSDAIVVGVRAFAPKYDPIVYKLTDEGVVFDQNAFNHLGYRNASVWMDSQFASESFALDAVTAMHAFTRMPGYSVNLQTWLQPDIFPLDVIRFQSFRFGTDWTRLMVTGVKHTVSKEPGSTVIQALYVPVFA